MSGNTFNNQPIFSSNISPAAALTRFQYQTYISGQAAQYSKDTLLLQSTFKVDPSNPYFYIFGGGPTWMFTDEDGNDVNGAFRTDFTFTNGGVTVSAISLYWGDGNTLDGNPTTDFVGVIPINTIALTPTLFYGPSAIAANDPNTLSCPFSLPGTTANGALTQWSCLADSVNVSTTILVTNLFNPQQATYGISGIYTAPLTLQSAGNNATYANGGPASMYHGIVQQPWGQ